MVPFTRSNVCIVSRKAPIIADLRYKKRNARILRNILMIMSSSLEDIKSLFFTKNLIVRIL